MENILPRVTIVILNWNGYKDTCECLNSIYQLNYPNFNVVICDNASTDGSISSIVSTANKLNLKFTCVVNNKTNDIEDITLSDLFIIENETNLGFAGGNNRGIYFALNYLSPEYIWILNNDTVPDVNSLTALIYRIIGDKKIGIVGSTLLYLTTPDQVQALGGASLNKNNGTGKHIGSGLIKENIPSQNIVEDQLDYIIGASMLVSRSFISSVGLMCEDYFLYYEEADWAYRGRKNGYKIAWAPSSFVLHKEGGSIGSSYFNRPSNLSLMYLYRNRLLFMRRFFPSHLNSVRISIMKELITYLKRLDFNAIRVISHEFLRDFIKFMLTK